MNLKLRIRSPTHIGTGDKLSGYEYLIDDGTMSVLDVDAYFRGHPDEIEAFSTAMEQTEQMHQILDHIEQYSQYAIDSWVDPDSDSIDDTPVSVALKDEAGLPYIPGTSIKGWIRNALAYRALEHGGLLGVVSGKTIENLFRVGENDEATEDLMRCVSVRDTDPVSVDNLSLFEIQTYLYRSEEKVEEAWSNYAECFTRDTELTTEITVDTELLNKLIKLHDADEKAETIFGDGFEEEEIVATISDALLDFQEAVIDEDKSIDDITDNLINTVEPCYNDIPTDSPLFRLGFGTGHHSKTVSVSTALSDRDRIIANVEYESNKLTHRAKCKGELERDGNNNGQLRCIECGDTGIQPNFSEIERFPKTRRFVPNATEERDPQYLLGWAEVSFY